MPFLLLALPQISDALQHRPLVAVPLLFAAGLVTSLNPCIYPMIPITAGALAGVNVAGRTRRRTVGLTLTYVTGLALFYALLGMIAGLTGSLFGTIGASVWARLAIGNLLLGATSGLVAAPCGAPAFAAVLTWVATTRSGALGFIYLFVFSLGMTALLAVVGLFSGTLSALPRAGAWMSWIKKGAGVVLLLMAEYYFVKAGQVW